MTVQRWFKHSKPHVHDWLMLFPVAVPVLKCATDLAKTHMSDSEEIDDNELLEHAKYLGVDLDKEPQFEQYVCCLCLWGSGRENATGGCDSRLSVA
jgi:hypothetical protein